MNGYVVLKNHNILQREIVGCYERGEKVKTIKWGHRGKHLSWSDFKEEAQRLKSVLTSRLY